MPCTYKEENYLGLNGKYAEDVNYDQSWKINYLKFGNLETIKPGLLEIMGEIILYHSDTLLLWSAYLLFKAFQLIFQKCGIISVKRILQPRELLIFIVSLVKRLAILFPWTPICPKIIHKNYTILFNSANLDHIERILRLCRNNFDFKWLETIQYRAD